MSAPRPDLEGAATLLDAICQDDTLLEVARKAIEDQLVEFRDERISVMRNNGLVIKERSGESSHIIRMGHEHALVTGLRAIKAALTARSESEQTNA